MLQFIRSRVTSIFAKILFGLLIVSFAVWGIGDIFFGNPAGKAAIEIGDDVRLTSLQVAEEFDRTRRNAGLQLTAEQAIQIGLLDRVIDGMVTEGLLQEAAHRLDLTVSSDRIGAFIRTQFRTPLGEFDRVRYQTFLGQTGQTEAEFVEQLRADLARQQLLGALTADASTSPAVVDTLAGYRGERRVASVVTIPVTYTPMPADPDEAELTGFFEDVRESFEIPELRGLSWVHVSTATLAETVDVSDEEVRALYDERADQLGTPERRRIDQMLFDTEEQARAADERLSQGEDFAAVARDLTGLEADALDLGELTRGELPESAAGPAFSVAEGSVTEPIQSPLGWHIFRVRAITPGVTVSYEQAAADLRAELAHDRALDIVYEVANQLEDTLAGGATLAEAAATVDLPVESIDAITAAGRTADGTPVSAELPGGQFLQIAFETPDGEQSVLGEGASGGFFVLRVDRVSPPRVPPLDEIRADVVAAWKRERRIELTEERAEALLARVEAGESATEIAAAEGLDVTVLEPITRDGRGLPAGYPGGLAATLFQLEAVGDTGLTGDDERSVLATLQEIVAPGDDALEIARDMLGRELAAGLETDVVELLLTDLRDRLPVSVDRQAVRTLFETVQ